MRFPRPDRQRYNVALLFLAQATLGAQLPMIFIVGGLAGQQLSPNPCFATLPISLIVFGSMTSAIWMSRLMELYGRRAGFLVGALAGLFGGLLGALALIEQSFSLFLASSYLTGIYMSAHGFYRFAATDTASQEYRPRAISYVMAGGLAAAVIGPQIVKVTTDIHLVPFLGTYLAVAVVNLIGSSTVLLLDIPKPSLETGNDGSIRSYRQLIKSPRIVRRHNLCNGVLCADESCHDFNSAGGSWMRIRSITRCGRRFRACSGNVCAVFLHGRIDRPLRCASNRW